ncbi:Histone methylation protein DOT1 [Stigmatella aurantiaca]|uniref:Histone-lysine N-methyltransferase, H3 lysine-79 specific n=1 Tax=Stigmatella aurantiaca TaxID=41 RepID=A0A1H7HQS4_STIAU|nr:methyltransferase domain-containing protein [Stigmatella aurantiaca]SEK52696.1 Histone methylation protein DOT1 [Stigmatella aurantiaca]
MELTRAQEIFDQLYGNLPGYEIARAEKQRTGRGDASTTYGEVVPGPFHEVVAAVSPQPGEQFIDLGSGTGKATILAAMLFPFSRVVGVELLPGLGDAARQVLQRYDAEVRPQLPPGQQAQRIEFIDGDMLELDFRDYDVVFAHGTCYGPQLMQQLAVKLEELKPGARAVIAGQTIQSPAFSVLGMKVMRADWGSSITALYQRR